MKKVACGKFVKRQNKNSSHSHFDGTWEELEKHVEICLHPDNKDYVHPGYRDGVLLIDLSYISCKFYTSILEIKSDTQLKANYAPRRPGENSFIRLTANGEKQPAKHVSIVVYRHDVLEESNERETNAEWEIVAIKARVSKEEEPMHYFTMARNYLELPGGTKGNFSADDFAQSILFWNNHVMVSPQKSVKNKILSFFNPGSK